MKNKVLVLVAAFALVLGATVANAQAVSCSLKVAADMTLGSQGASVVELQDMLISKGHLVMPAGVSKGYFGALTQSALAKYQAAMGITPASGYFGPATKASVVCSTTTTTTTTTGSLSGGDGDVASLTKTTSGTETTLGEGKTEDVLGFDLEADDNSDLEVTSVRVVIGTETGASSRLTKYLDQVAIMLDGDEVGSVDASDFSRKGATSTATISLKKAIVEAGEEGRFYVTLTASDSINTSEISKELYVVVDRVRVEDASGAVLTESPEGISATVDFEDASANDDSRVKSSSATRDAGLLKVNENTVSDDFGVLTFEIKVDDDSSDLVVTSIPVELSIVNGSSTGVLDVNKLIQDIWLEIDGERYDDYSIENTSIAGGATEVSTTTFTIDEGDLEIAEGDTVEAVVFVKFAKQDGNYAEGTKVTAKVTGADISAENMEGDSFAVSGTVNGKQQTVQISAAAVESFTWSVNNPGTIVDFFFTVEAIDEDFSVLSSSIASTTSGTATTTAGALTFSSGDEPDTISGGFKVLDGDTATFRVRYSLSSSATNGQYAEIKITSVAGQQVPTTKQVSPTATKNVTN